MFYGADTTQLSDLGQAMKERSNRIADRLESASSIVMSVSWDGSDAAQFRDEFFGPVTDAWTQMVDLMRAYGDEIGAHADEQDRASDGIGSLGEKAVESDRMPTPQERDPIVPPINAPVMGTTDERAGTDPVASNPDGSIDGTDPYPGNGLGPGVPGTEAEAPEPPAWSPADAGSGEWNSREPTEEDYEAQDLAKLLVAGGRVTGRGAASDNLQHYLDNTGEDKPINVDDMLDEVPSLATAVDQQRSTLGQEAIARARQNGATGPVTFPVNTEWEGGSASPTESSKFYYATGSFDYNQTGTVTAYPPMEPGGEWTYALNTAVNVRDRYNWDTGKGVTLPVPDWVPGIPDGGYIPDTQMQGLHQSGLAREYNIVGASETSAQSGP